MQTFFRALASLSLGLVLVGCGDDDGGSVDCSAITPCGGEVVGTWQFVGNCEGEDPFCPDLVVESTPSASGSFTFEAGGTYTTMSTLNGTSRARIPGSCIDGATMCSDLDFEDQTCTGDIATACTCTTTYNNTQDSTSGTYTTSGTSITLDGETFPYCVSGNTLRLDLGDGFIVVLGK